jgi:hypothetical protein
MSSNYGNPSITWKNVQTPYTSQGHHGFYQNHGEQTKFSWKPSASQNPSSSFPLNPPQPRLPFLTTLHFPYLSRLLNDPICHDLHWPPFPTKFPSDIPKFEGKPGEDPGDHVTTFHLWCSSNSLKDESVQLHLFQRTLVGGVVKWYIELDSLKYSYFNNMAMVFLNHFQLPMRYDADTKLLPNFKQMKDVHIYDHIRESSLQKSLIKVKVPLTFFLEWFLKSLVPCVSKYVMNSRVFFKEETIMRAQQLELIYSQSGMLHKILPDAP